MFIQDQDSVKKELVKRFASKVFSQIDDIFSEEEDDVKEEEGCVEKTPNDRVSTHNIIDVKNSDIIETRVEEFENIPPPMYFFVTNEYLVIIFTECLYTLCSFA